MAFVTNIPKVEYSMAKQVGGVPYLEIHIEYYLTLGPSLFLYRFALTNNKVK